MSEAEAHFNRVKALQEQQALDLESSAGQVVRGPWVAMCGDPGPYSIRKPTPSRPNRLVVLTCTRPTAHRGAFHHYADEYKGIVAQWTRGGDPDFPPIAGFNRPAPNPEGDS